MVKAKLCSNNSYPKCILLEHLLYLLTEAPECPVVLVTGNGVLRRESEEIQRKLKEIDSYNQDYTCTYSDAVKSFQKTSSLPPFKSRVLPYLNMVPHCRVLCTLFFLNKKYSEKRQEQSEPTDILDGRTK